MQMVTQKQVKDLFYYQDGKLFNRLDRKGSSKKGQEAGSLRKCQNRRFITIDNKNHHTHRLVFLYHHGYLPDYVDHINGDPSDNRIENLRECTKQQNSFNQKLSEANTSGVKGVNWNKRQSKWMARVMADGKSNFLGFFSSIQDAEKAVREKRIELHGEFACHG